MIKCDSQYNDEVVFGNEKNKDYNYFISHDNSTRIK